VTAADLVVSLDHDAASLAVEAVADLCTLVIVLSDNTATNMLIDMLGGAVVASPRQSVTSAEPLGTATRPSCAVCSRTCTPVRSSMQPHQPR
jgi:Beta-lactamase enzyme family